MPAAQRVQVALDVALRDEEYVSRAQGVQLVLPVDDDQVPAPHGWHASTLVDPLFGLAVPATHRAHVDAPTAFEYVPAEQFLQIAAPIAPLPPVTKARFIEHPR